ncbi:lipoyltransferase 1, mitochondrial isoform X2 [Aethina tumida]|uniref:lipoyltransferase 1, mitochondrial isoform X2 n=1 Tax=Aethina tumida TaxID=116153 RepID=UPI00214997D8|nr:lipoyltransferase 1, mitochondrial isoform X2 [Aethina tumida]
MALVQSTCFKVGSLISRVSVRCMSTPVHKQVKKVDEKDIKKSVFISQSKDIYTNLALEDWLYKNFDFTNHHVLMLWQNDPCVVIGRHQNPWLEANISHLPNITENGVKLARRNSGGGTVYHDLGNLNMTFFTAKEHYNRKYNLEIVKRSIFREYGVKVDVSPREDLTLRDFKISGTAAKLGRPNAYHHCTLLVNANKVDLTQALHKEEDVDIKTNATQSVKSKIMNLCEENPKINVQQLSTAVGWEFMRTTALSLKDGGMELANQQKGFQMVQPSEQWFPGITEIRNQFESWDWCYGKSPKFTISKCFNVPDSLAINGPEDLKITMSIESGRISEISLYIPPGLSSSGFSGEANVITSFKGHKFTEEMFNNLELSLGGLVNDKDKFVTECLRKVMTSV